jgi:hypothetical protein
MQIPVSLKSHPQLRRCFQQSREAKRCVRSDAPLTEDNLVQPVERDAEPLGGLELTQTDRLQVLLEENLACKGLYITDAPQLRTQLMKENRRWSRY